MTQIASFWPTRLPPPISASSCGDIPLPTTFSLTRTFLCEVSKLNLHQLLGEHLNDAKNVSVCVCSIKPNSNKEQLQQSQQQHQLLTLALLHVAFFSACSLLFHILYITWALKGSDKWLAHKLRLQTINYIYIFIVIYIYIFAISIDGSVFSQMLKVTRHKICHNIFYFLRISSLNWQK